MNDHQLPLPETDGRTIFEVDVDGQRYKLYLPDAETDYIQKKVATDRRPYEHEMLLDMAARLKRGDLVVDAGANVGNHTLYLAAVVGCRVEAFEANPTLCAAVSASAALNGLDASVHAHALGLGAAAGRARFGAARPDNLGAQSLTVGEGEIEVVALDTWTFDAQVRGLKVDVEGMEIDVLRGAETTIRRDRPIVYIECIADRDFRTVSRWLDAREYVHWDTFNATPTHLFLPAESVTLERRIARLQLRSALEDYRQTALATNIRQKLTRAYENERDAKQKLAALEQAQAQLQAEIERSDTDLAEARAALLASQAAGQRERDAHAAAVAERDASLQRLTAAEQVQAQLQAKIERSDTDLAEARAALLASQAAGQRERDAHATAVAELDATLRQLTASERARRDESARAAVDAAAWQQRHNLLQQDARYLEQQLAKLRGEHARVLRLAEVKAVRAEAQSARVVHLESRLESLRLSGSFLLGQALVSATRSARGAVGLPAALWRIVRDRHARRARLDNIASGRAPTRRCATSEPDAMVTRGVAAPEADRPLETPSAPEEPAQPTPRAARNSPFTAVAGARRVNDLKVACIVDDFTFQCFEPECRLLALEPDRWQQQVDEFQPDMVFVESAWRGVDGLWERKISDGSPQLDALLSWATERGIPTAFWCKEDPVHFARFLPVARKVDHVFTTDIDCIDRYRDALKHRNVYLLPFAAQPAFHNPIETVPRVDGFCFAGSYYPQYPQRQKDFAELVSVGRKLKSVAIYDRNADRPPPHDFVFPDEYRAEILGSLPYAQVDRAYKGFRYGITVNTIKQSQTMFARRAYELMACNTVVVSNYAKGLRMLFGDLAISSDSAVELERRLDRLCGDDLAYRRHRLQALRKVMSQHTYAHRLQQIAACLFDHVPDTGRIRIRVVAEPACAADARRAVETVSSQTQADVALTLIGPHAGEVAAHGTPTRFSDRREFAASIDDDEWIAVIDADDHLGRNYLQDMALALAYAQADAITKDSHFARAETGLPALQDRGTQYTLVDSAVLGKSLVRGDACRAIVREGTGPLPELVMTGGRILSVDEFNYCRGGAALPDTRGVDADDDLFAGADLLRDVLPAAESTVAAPAAADAESDARPIVLQSADWVRLLPGTIDERITIAAGETQSVRLTSTLDPGAHQYLYLTRRFSAQELGAGHESFFQWQGEVRMDLRTVFVFHDAQDKKLSHVMHTLGARYELQIPPGTASVRLALRVQGPGHANLASLTLAEPRGLPLRLLPVAKHLVLATQYPGYDDLYRYGFVHARSRGYARAGLPVEVLRLNTDPAVRFREFENFEVTEADTARLVQALGSGHYESVLVHILDQRMWTVLKPNLDHVRVVVWAHGAEIQPWWRRAMNFETDALRDQARRNSDARLEMWRDVLTCGHPNLDVVFISRKQLREAVSDLRLHPDRFGRVHVIHNFIDGELFPYREKDPAQRNRILSIRPYASSVYANDQTVDAIVRLIGEPFFDQLKFCLVGDGALFDATVAPLHGLPNVRIRKAFLTQREIAELHRDYGVFLVPSRMDSQGVSRDEAMSSGLVPVTTRIAAIPEFVDVHCSLLVAPEDSAGLAEAVRRLHEDPALFAALSKAAAQRVRSQSGYHTTLARELALAQGQPPDSRLREELTAEASGALRLALYGDVNLNIMDGSAIWATSLAETLAANPNTRVSLLLKARVHRTEVIARLLDLTPQVQLIEPDLLDRSALQPQDAVTRLADLDTEIGFAGFILRGLDLCSHAVEDQTLHGRVWSYLTDIPQRREDLDEQTRLRIERIVAGSRFVLCQTPQMLDYFVGQFPTSRAKARLLPPMIPPLPAGTSHAPTDGPFRLAYAGKFAPRWGIRELAAAFATLRRALPDAELHVFGDKIHNPADDPSFRPEVLEFLERTPGVLWHGAVDRDRLLRELGTMHMCWAFRDPAFERETLELSTKALEYASLAVPILLARSAVYEGVFGADYPLFADSASGASALLVTAAQDARFRAAARGRLVKAASVYTFDAVSHLLLAQGLLERPAPTAPLEVLR